MLQWNVYIRGDQHQSVVKKLCRKLKVEPINCIFEISGLRDKLSSCQFEVELESTGWSEAVAESLVIANRLNPHWRMTVIPGERLTCNCQECNVGGVESVSWDLQVNLK